MTIPDHSAPPLRILHVLRAPLGGLFRHVVDLTRAQAARGHLVGMVTDSLTGGARAEQALVELAPALALGVTRIAMRRNPHPSDIVALARVLTVIRTAVPDVVHGHGSKGAVYARAASLMPGGGGPVRAYTPHGGSFNYRPGSGVHRVYMKVERLLAGVTDIFLFESAFIEARFRHYVGATRAPSRVIVNGISPCEFVPVAPDADAADFLYVGELRSAKGIDTLIDALALVRDRTSAAHRAVLVGSGPDQALLTEHARHVSLQHQISFAGAMPARDAFRLGRVMVVPSRAESLPYVVLEAAGARVPLIATNVGGIPEIFGPHAGRLIACDNPMVLADEMLRQLHLAKMDQQREAQELAEFVEQRFSIARMTDGVIAGYRSALAARLASRTGAAAAAVGGPAKL